MDHPFKAYQGSEPYVFVCYSHADKDLVFPEIALLRDAGVHIWYDEGIQAGREWSEELGQAIEGADRVLFFVSPRSVASEHCRDEIHFAKSRSKGIIALHLEPTSLPTGLELALGSSQAIFVDAIGIGEGRRKVKEAIANPVSGSSHGPGAALLTVRSKPTLRWMVVAAVVSVLAVGLLATHFLIDEEPATQPIRGSVAVLPFVTIGSSPTDEYLGDGVAEVLIHQLSNVPGIKVIARTSSFAFKNTTSDVREIGRRLGVAAVLEGSVQRSGTDVRISVQMIDTQTGISEWQETFTRSGEEIFSIQDEIADHVVTSLTDAFAPRPAEWALTDAGTANLEAYEEYLQGLAQLRRGSVESLPKAIDHFERAIELDDHYNEARLKLIETYNAQNYIFQIDYAELALRNQTIPREVLRRNPNSARARNFLAVADFSLHFPTGSGEAEKLWTEALAIAPHDPVILATYAYYLAWNDKPDQAMAALEKALDVDPFLPRALAAAARQGHPKFAERLRAYYPESPAGWAIQGELDIRRGKLTEAYQSFRLAESKSPHDPEFPAMQAIVLMTVDLVDAAEAAVLRAEAKGPGASVSVAARIALTLKRDGVVVAGEMALNALRNGLPPRQFSVIVTQLVGLRHALSSNPEDFLEAMARWQDGPGVSGRGDIRDLEILSPIDYDRVMNTIPALQAAGETDVADRLLAKASDYFANASSTLRKNETRYRLDLHGRNLDAALDTLETLIDGGRSGWQYTALNNPSAYRWWLEFDGILATPLHDNPRYKEIMKRRATVIARERAAILRLINGDEPGTPPRQSLSRSDSAV